MALAGVIFPPRGYLEYAAEYVRQAGGVFIADEVQTGFGRLGECFWAFQHNGNKSIPDIVTMAKPFGNGMPLGAVVTTRRVAEAFEVIGPEYFNTYGGNPVCAAAGLAVLDVIESEHLQAKASKMGSYLKSRFSALKERLDIIGDVRGCGLFIGVELVRDRETLEPATEETSFVCTQLKEKYSILTSVDGPKDNVLVIKPPLVFTEADANYFVESFENAVTKDLNQVEDIMRVVRTPT
jgi:4-aminobutyrate aminotransferase-like enzyme